MGVKLGNQKEARRDLKASTLLCSLA